MKISEILCAVEKEAGYEIRCGDKRSDGCSYEPPRGPNPAAGVPVTDFQKTPSDWLYLSF